MAETELKILALSLFVITQFVAVNGYGTIVGGRTPISDARTNKGIQALGMYAVNEYNKGQRNNSSGGGGADDEIVFSQVVEAEKQVVSGIKYFLKIEAKEDGQTKTFESVVLIKPWATSDEKELISFSASSQPPQPQANVKANAKSPSTR